MKKDDDDKKTDWGEVFKILLYVLLALAFGLYHLLTFL